MRNLVGSKAKVLVLALTAAVIMGFCVQLPAASASVNKFNATTGVHKHHHHHHHHHKHKTAV